jgi:hypothetical protein
MWQDILKRVDIRNEREYEAASLEDRKIWHSSQSSAYAIRWRAMRNTQVENEDSPMYKEMVELQDLSNFHGRQRNRLKRNINNKTYYSMDLEGDNRQKHKTRKSPQGNLTPYTELTQEVYETLNNKDKNKYHVAMSEKPNISMEEKSFHYRMRARLRFESVQPTFASLEHGGETIYNTLSYSKEEYVSLNDKEKLNYHRRMARRFKVSGDMDKGKWHQKMVSRLKNKSKQLAFYSQEEEQKNA